MDAAYSDEEKEHIRRVHDAGPPCLGCYFCEPHDVHESEHGESGA